MFFKETQFELRVLGKDVSIQLPETAQQSNVKCSQLGPYDMDNILVLRFYCYILQLQ